MSDKNNYPQGYDVPLQVTVSVLKDLEAENERLRQERDKWKKIVAGFTTNERGGEIMEQRDRALLALKRVVRSRYANMDKRDEREESHDAYLDGCNLLTELWGKNWRTEERP